MNNLGFSFVLQELEKVKYVKRFQVRFKDRDLIYSGDIMKIWIENKGSEDEALLIQSKGSEYKGITQDYNTESIHTHKLMRNGAYKSPCPHNFHDYKIFGIIYGEECKDSSHLFEIEAKDADRLFTIY